MPSLATKTPAEIDAQFARLEAELYNVERSEAIFKRVIETPTASEEEVAEAQRRLAVTSQSRKRIGTQFVSLNAEYARRGGWTRYYMVNNTNGHLHTTTQCRNTYASTPWHWVTELSGATADEAVADAGARSCLTCFPAQRDIIEAGRPCRIENPVERKTREEREAAAAAKAAKAAAAAAKAITNPDGTPLVIPDTVGTRTLKTEVAAQRAALQAAGDLLWYPNSSDADAMREAIRLCTVALAHKRGTTPETERKAILAKAQAKYDRETAAATN